MNAAVVRATGQGAEPEPGGRLSGAVGQDRVVRLLLELPQPEAEREDRCPGGPRGANPEQRSRAEAAGRAGRRSVTRSVWTWPSCLGK